MNPILRSALVTFVASFIALIPIAPLSDDWFLPALFGAGIAGLRTLLSWLDPGNPLFGVGKVDHATPDDPEVVDIQG
jgi:hypothetical protein